MDVLIANSVGVDRDGYHMVHVPSRWSLGVKNFTNCGYYPWQLAYTSSLLKRDTYHSIKLLDGVLRGWDVETYLKHAGCPTGWLWKARHERFARIYVLPKLSKKILEPSLFSRDSTPWQILRKF